MIQDSRSFAVATAGFILASSVFVASSASAADWKGTEETKDGVLHILNPETPSNGSTTIELEELWRLGGDTDDEDEFFGLISQVALDDSGNAYLLDTQLNEVKIYDPEGNFLRSIGREGEGPGEFRGGSDLFFTPKGEVGVLQSFPTKIVLMTKDGEPAGEHPTPVIEGDGFVMVQGARQAGNRLGCLAMVNNFNQEKGEFTMNLKLLAVEEDGTVSATFHEETALWQSSNPVVDDTSWDKIRNRWDVGNDKIFGCKDFSGYKIHAWNMDGTVDRVIERESTPHKRTPAEIKEIEGIFAAFLTRLPGSTVKISDFDKDITKIYSRDDGSLWVQSGVGTRVDEGILGVFDVFNAEGHFVQQVTLKGEGHPMQDGYFFRGDRLYVVTEFLSAAIAMQGGSTETEDEDPEPMAVICYKIDGNKIAMK